MQQVIVYKARPEAALIILGILREEDLNPVALDNTDVTQQYYSGFTYLVRIAVPKDEAGKARSILTQWEKQEKTTVNRLSRQFSMQIAYVVLCFAIVYGILLLLSELTMMDTFAVLYSSVIITFIFVVYIYNRRKRWRDPQSPVGDCEHDHQSEDPLG